MQVYKHNLAGKVAGLVPLDEISEATNSRGKALLIVSQ
jgi:hypothetical protein